MLHYLGGIYLRGIILDSGMWEGVGGCLGGRGGMQGECVGFGLPGILVDSLLGNVVAPKMDNEVGKTRNDGVKVLLELVVLGCKIRERGRRRT